MKPKIGVGILIINDNKVLLGLRNPNRKKDITEIKGEGTWTMPGGKVEFMETLLEAAMRELKEETNLTSDNLNFLCISDDMTETAHYVTIGFIATSCSGELKIMEPEIIIEWKWFDLNKLPTNIYEPSRKCIEKYKNKVIYV